MAARPQEGPGRTYPLSPPPPKTKAPEMAFSVRLRAFEQDAYFYIRMGLAAPSWGLAGAVGLKKVWTVTGQ